MSRAYVESWRISLFTEEVRHGDVTAGVKRVWNVITAEKYSFFQS